MRTHRVTVAFVAAALAFAGAETATTATATTSQTWLQRVNQVRAASGLSSVTEDTSLDLGIAHHLTYLRLNPTQGKGFRTGQYQSAHTENPAARGYTTDGAAAADHSDIAFAKYSDIGAIDGWLEAPFHTVSILNPALTEVAFGRDATTGDALLDTGDTSGTPAVDPIFYPGDSGTTDLTRFGGENPDPTETCRGLTQDSSYGAGTPARGLSGLPLLAILPGSALSGLDVSATLTGPDGTVSGTAAGSAASASDASEGLCVVDSNDFTTSDTVYGPTGQQILDSGVVMLIPKAPLVPGSYTASLTVQGGTPYSWTFTSAPKATSPLLGYSALCSYTNPAYASGEARIQVTNPADTTQAATYAVQVGSISKTVSNVADGRAAESALFTHLRAAHTYTVTATGGDGTSQSRPLTVPSCSPWSAFRIGTRMVYHAKTHSVSMDLVNVRNLAGVRVTISRTHLSTLKYAVAGKKSRTASFRINRHGRTTMVVKVDTHKVLSTYLVLP
ncbi:MAG: CAP domain-containing protein [Nocardioidaceae bacterium]